MHNTFHTHIHTLALAQEACFTDIVVLYRRKADAAAAGGGGEKEIIKDVDPVGGVGVGSRDYGGATCTSGTSDHIKLFRGIPLADLPLFCYPF